ncbi:uncharacterized protein F5147DRAFT_670203 [Suillus discolor]|uniref:Uncharacterized protein n=1 Tax=Suillus discolor TaxID=1912936 RepID=A0A9P7JZP6_9AGAM|nr:uncharacterized protein F5147DRAFT_670203 [Suillus discolor]KAG2118159.1 hypothetical protein F5147DRAFT_670203 [Suillus discolor]
MSRYNNYTTPPRSPTFGFFPTAPSSPHAFSAMQGNPRDSHNMYSALSSSMGFQSSSQPRQSNGGSSNPLMKFYRK